MGWISNDDTIEELLELRPELKEKYLTFLETLRSDETIPNRLLELCRLRIAAIHDCKVEFFNISVDLGGDELDDLKQGNFASFTEIEQAALQAAECIPYQHHQLSDEQVEKLKSEFGNQGVVTLLTALAFFDVTCRLKLSLGIA